MSYRVDDNGYSCVECGARHWSREEAEDCERSHSAIPRGTNERIGRLKLALRLATERWRRCRAEFSAIVVREADGSGLLTGNARAPGTAENPQPWRPIDQAAYDRCELWNGWRFRMERELGRMIRRRCSEWNAMALDR